MRRLPPDQGTLPCSGTHTFPPGDRCRAFPDCHICAVAEKENSPLFYPSLLRLLFHRKVKLGSLLIRTTQRSHRTLPAFRFTIRKTYDSPQLDQPLIKVSGAVPGDHFLQQSFDLLPCPGFGDILRICQQTGHHPEHVAVYSGLRNSVYKRTDRPCSIVPDP